MLRLAVQHIINGLEAAMWVIWEATVLGDGEFVEEEEWVEVADFRASDRSMDADANLL
ncbi:hypothetical protein BGX30_007902, partial [Mortierella sp. GBA39]